MTPLVFLAIAVAGGVGAAARFALDGFVGHKWQTTFPWATFVINVSGSLALGLVSAAAAGVLLPQEWSLILGAGFLGGYTTFSTTSHETIRLLLDRRILASAANGLGTLAASVGAAALGYWLGSLL